jgi:hypothetical protein
MKQILFIILTITLFIISCKKETETVQLHKDYSPMIEGRFVIYDASEITHDDDVNQHDTVHFLLKTVIGQVYYDNEGRAGREYLRYTSTDSAATWQLKDVWTTFSDGNRLELVEENERMVKLLFAPTLSKEWDINAYNTRSKQNASYSSVHKSFQLNGKTFDSTVIVEQANFFSLVDLKRQNEVYAKGVGLVSKYYKDLTIENFDSLNVKKGKELYYNCISFGIE